MGWQSDELSSQRASCIPPLRSLPIEKITSQNPTLQAIFPLSSTLNIIRTLDPSLTPIPNATTFGTGGSAYAQLFYAGVEQFYCHADSCTQNTKQGNTDWNCQNLQCTCRSKTNFCGGGQTDLSGAINGLGGNLTISCGTVDTSTNTATCGFKQSTLQSLFGSQGLTLNGCSFGECVRQSVIDSGGNATSTGDQTGKAPLNGGVIAGLAVVGTFVFLALLLLVYGVIMQRKVRKSGSGDLAGIQVGVEWTNVSYIVPGSGRGLFKKRGLATITDDKAVLDNVTGKVPAGSMMAILGPSGTYRRNHSMI